MISARFINRFLALCLVLAAPTCKFAQPVASQPAQQTRIALRAARLLDVRSGQMIKNPIILIEGERIKAVGPKVNTPADARVINLGDVTLLPGLIDAH